MERCYDLFHLSTQEGPAGIGACVRINETVAAELKPWFPDISLERVRIVQRGPACWFVRSVLRQGALTFSPFIFFGGASYDASDAGSVALLAHELKHVEQYKRYGRPGFLFRYFRDLARGRFRYSHDLPLEREAYALQAEVEAALSRSSGDGGTR